MFMVFILQAEQKSSFQLQQIRAQARNLRTVCEIYSASQGPGKKEMTYSSGGTEEGLGRYYFITN